AIAQIRQPAGQLEPGTTQVRVDIVRPPIFGESELIVESGITTVIWRAPALTIRAYGPEKAESDLPFEYIVEITNPGDLVARAVVVKMKNLDSGVNYISSSPSPQQFANTYQWDLGDVTPGGTPKQIRIQLKSNKLGSVGAFFEVVSEADRLKTEAPVETEIIQPCLNLSINGPAEAVEGESISLNLGLENRCGEGLANVKIAIKWPNDFVRLNTNLPQGAASFTNSFMPAAQRDDIPTLTFQTRAAGEHCFEVEVSADGVQTLKKSYCLTVKPKSGGLLNGLNSPVVTAKNQLQLRLDLGNKVQLNKCLVTATITNPSNTDATQITLTNRFSLDLSAAMLKPPQQLQVQPVTDNKKEFFLTIPRIPAGGSYPITIEYAVVPFKQLQDNKSLFSITSLDGTSFSKEIELDLK
ncbi:hypothetical protein N9043_01335, partial [bacterium]|nr:hypothetical protein [bacterium]